MLAQLILLPLLAVFSTPVGAKPPPPDTYWNVDTPIDVNDTFYAGLPRLSPTHTLIYNGSAVGRTYAHHAILHAVGKTVYLLHTSTIIDEDAMGQEPWVSVSHDGGYTWSKSKSLMPTALLPNQTELGPANYSFWCTNRIWQRALSPTAVLDIDGVLWAYTQTVALVCPSGSSKERVGAGNVARAMDINGNPVGDPCWVEKTEWTDVVGWSDTIYGTKYGMKMCKDAARMQAIVDSPAGTTMYSDWIFNNVFRPMDNEHVLEEPTHGVWIKDKTVCNGGFWMRFWRDGSGQEAFTGRVWVQYTTDPEGQNWYPKKLDVYDNKINVTNIPDRGTKEYFGALRNGDRYMVHNPRYNVTCFSQCVREPLVVSMSRGDDLTFRWTGVLRTNASRNVVPGKSKNPGFSYPSAVEVDGNFLVAYSENKENIWLSRVPLKDLPGYGKAQY